MVLFNPESFPLLIGTAVFAFEGIGLYVYIGVLGEADSRVIPITETMKEPTKFPRALSGVMLVVAVLFAGFGVLGYAAYGSDVKTVVLLNLPQEQKFVQASQFLCEYLHHLRIIRGAATDLRIPVCTFYCSLAGGWSVLGT